MAAPTRLGTSLHSEFQYQQAQQAPSLDWSEFCSNLNEWCGSFLEVIYARNGIQQTHLLSSTSGIDQGTFSTATVQLLHQTVKDFFRDRPEMDPWFMDDFSRDVTFERLCKEHAQLQEARFSHSLKASIAEAPSSSRTHYIIQFFRDQFFLLWLLQAGRIVSQHRSLGYLIDRTIRSQENWLDPKEYEASRFRRPSAFTSITTFNENMTKIFQEVCISGSVTAAEWVLRSLITPATWLSGHRDDPIVDWPEPVYGSKRTLASWMHITSTPYLDHMDDVCEILPALLLQSHDTRSFRPRMDYQVSDRFPTAQKP